LRGCKAGLRITVRSRGSGGSDSRENVVVFMQFQVDWGKGAQIWGAILPGRLCFARLPIMFVVPEWGLLYVSLPVPRTLRWLLDFY
jgi:hypothetical protein